MRRTVAVLALASVPLLGGCGSGTHQVVTDAKTTATSCPSGVTVPPGAAVKACGTNGGATMARRTQSISDCGGLAIVPYGTLTAVQPDQPIPPGTRVGVIDHATGQRVVVGARDLCEQAMKLAGTPGALIFFNGKLARH